MTVHGCVRALTAAVVAVTVAVRGTGQAMRDVVRQFAR
jgi:hypothetical protein